MAMSKQHEDLANFLKKYSKLKQSTFLNLWLNCDSVK